MFRQEIVISDLKICRVTGLQVNGCVLHKDLSPDASRDQIAVKVQSDDCVWFFVQYF